MDAFPMEPARYGKPAIQCHFKQLPEAFSQGGEGVMFYMFISAYADKIGYS